MVILYTENFCMSIFYLKELWNLEMITGREFAKRIKELSAKNSIPVKRVLEDCKINRNYIYDLENKIKYPQWEKILDIAQYFNVSTDYILGLTDSATPYAQQGEILSDPEHELLSGYRQLDESDQGEVRGYIKGMLNNDKYKTHNEEAIG